MLKSIVRATAMVLGLGLLTAGPVAAQDAMKTHAKDLAKATKAQTEAGLKGDKAKQDEIGQVIKTLEDALNGEIARARPAEIDNDPKVKETKAVRDAAYAAWQAIHAASDASAILGDAMYGTWLATFDTYLAAWKKNLDAYFQARDVYRTRLVQEALDQLDQPPKAAEEKPKPPAAAPVKKQAGAKKARKAEGKRAATEAPRRAATAARPRSQQPAERFESGAGGGGH